MASERPGISPGIERSKSIEDLHHLRLMALLDELVRDKGPRRAAADLDVDHRTLTASLESGRLSRRMRVALNQSLLAGAGSPAREQQERNDELAGRLERVEGRVDDLGKEMNEGLSAVQGEVRSLRKDHARDLQRVESRLAKMAGGDGAAGSASAPHAGRGSAGRASPRREYPELATLEPADDDEDVFGDAWPLIQEWREFKETHPNRGKGLSWLRTEERFLAVELALLEEHGLTLPPARFPLRGFDRNGQTGWRRKALDDTREALRRRRLLAWAGRALTLTLGRWRS